MENFRHYVPKCKILMVLIPALTLNYTERKGKALLLFTVRPTAKKRRMDPNDAF